MFRLHRYKIKLQGFIFTKTPLCPIPFRPLRPFRLPFSLEFSSTASDSRSFTVSYLVNNCGFPSESALKVSKLVHFQTSEKPDSVLNLLKNHGFSNSQIHSVIKKAPRLLLCDSDTRVLPKFEFFLSKGLSTSDIVLIVTRCPYLLLRSLQNHISPVYGMVKELLQSDEKAIKCIKWYPSLLYNSNFLNNVELLRDSRVADLDIAKLLAVRPTLFCISGLGKVVEEVRQLGFDPSKTKFSLALTAKQSLGKSYWDVKVNAYKKWGWSEEIVMEAFRRHPYCMLHSMDKINAVMNYWVNELGWDSLTLASGSAIIGYNLQRRVIPRASVVQFLLSRGLISKYASLLTPFFLEEKLFLRRYVECFEEETPKLLKLYEKKMNFQDKGEKGGQ